jgi:hypothetical protein
MNSKHRRTLAAVFADPVPASIRWADIEALLAAAGCEVTEGAGSRVRFVRGEETFSAHRPHPRPEAKRYQVRQVREFLQRIGVTP